MVLEGCRDWFSAVEFCFSAVELCFNAVVRCFGAVVRCFGAVVSYFSAVVGCHRLLQAVCVLLSAVSPFLCVSATPHSVVVRCKQLRITQCGIYCDPMSTEAAHNAAAAEGFEHSWLLSPLDCAFFYAQHGSTHQVHLEAPAVAVTGKHSAHTGMSTTLT